MNDRERKINKFSKNWFARGGEKGDTQKFWLALLRDVLEIEEPENIIDFEKYVIIDDQKKYIDGYIARTKVLIEQKSFGKDLDKTYQQSDDENLTPLEQAERYADYLPFSEQPRWIITCNFSEFRIYDRLQMKNPTLYLSQGETYKPTIYKLQDFRYVYKNLKFLVDPTAEELKPEIKISKAAANIIKVIYEAFEKNYSRLHIKDYKNFLDKLCTRLVFCFYAGDALIFNDNQFFKYIAKFATETERIEALQNIFDVLNTPEENRSQNLDDDLKNFPYVNGGLFGDKISLPAFNNIEGNFTETISLANIEDKLNWRKISPPIFGAMFESILNEETRREGGMYYTTPENIHKVIDPLFLDDLYEEFNAIKRKRNDKIPLLQEFQDKIAALTFLDPACGSGNFLTETYMSLRRLENEILKELRALNVPLPENPVKVSINQFFGIELHDFAVAVAQVALWIAEIQMLQETEGELGKDFQYLPLKSNPAIICANANQIDWSELVTPEKLNYIIGNPPFKGARKKSKQQSDDIKKVFEGWDNTGNLDYVSCWYKKISDFIHGTNIRAALVSTNSICQGESIGALWKKLFASGIHFDFAHRTFKWLSDSDNPAHVHCVVVGFSKAHNPKPKKIFDGDQIIKAKNINAYLVDDEDIFVESRDEPLCDVPEIGIGNKPVDDGNYLFKPAEMENFLKREPDAIKFFHPWYGADEFIKGKKRYCLWLGDTPLDEIKKFPLCWERVENVRAYRLASKSDGTRQIAEKPTRFHVENFPHGKFLVMAKTSSGERQYIPMGFMNDSVLCSDKVFILPDAQIYHFGILTSSIHMAWMRMTNCPLGTSYSYSIGIVYNNFPWPKVDERHRKLIERSAQLVLDVRKEFPDWTFAKLYNEDTMPAELRWAHKSNDYAVALAYGFEKFFEDEEKVVSELMKLYKRLTSG